MLKEDIKIFYRNVETNNINSREPISIVKMELSWKYLWGE
jgi:hypothetical protein